MNRFKNLFSYFHYLLLSVSLLALCSAAASCYSNILPDKSVVSDSVNSEKTVLQENKLSTDILRLKTVGTVDEKIKTKDSTDMLNGKIICIDPGHQIKPDIGKEPLAPGSHILKEKVSAGTKGIMTHIPEYALNLEVSLKLRDLLIKHKAKVVMTRQTNSVDISNIDRAKIANRAHADMIVRIHADGSNNSSVNGISVLIPGRKYVHDAAMLTKSRLAAEYTLKEMIAGTGAVSRGVVERNDLTGFNWSAVPVFLIEMGFMTNAHEDRMLETTGYQEKLIAGIVKGLEDYFRNS